jgi:hypothetical protein
VELQLGPDDEDRIVVARAELFEWFGMGWALVVSSARCCWRWRHAATSGRSGIVRRELDVLGWPRSPHPSSCHTTVSRRMRTEAGSYVSK